MTDRSNTAELTSNEIVDALTSTGLAAGNVVLVHSAMRTLGRVQGGAGTVVDALLKILGEKGTLVVPTFTFAHEAESDPVIDPTVDRSEMGAITEQVRSRPNALRSTAYRHSFAAIGRWAEVLSGVDPALAAYDMRSSFGVMLGLNTQVLLLGVTYSSSTSHHFAEWMCNVPYRHTIDLQVKVRKQDGSVVPQAMVDYQPFSYGGNRHPDFNRLGKLLEDQGKVGVGSVGNAVARRFAMRDLVDLAQSLGEDDPNIFRTAEGKTEEYTLLNTGRIVLSPEMPDGAGRMNRYQWCVLDESKLGLPSTD